ncbi:MAG: hypothetical protein PHV42_00460 [Candidatus Pacebacteria bacterium]|nr:hypothetical protein [Candidatus Paceibacterota bacterium]
MQNIFSVKNNMAKIMAGALVLVVALFCTVLPSIAKADDYGNADYGTTYNADYGTSYNADYGTTYNADYGTTYNADYGTSYNADYGSTYSDNTGCTDCNTANYSDYNNYNSGCTDGCDTSYYNNYSYDSGCSYGCYGNYSYGCTSGCNTYIPPHYNPPHYTPPPTPIPYPQLSVSCSSSDSNIQIGDSVTWRANVNGGNGNYSYNWSGDASGSGQTVSRTYNSSGTKYATVTVTSGNQTGSATCNTFVENQNNNNLDAYCTANVTNNNNNGDQEVRWTVYPSGGNGNYHYNWSGTDGLDGSSQTVYNTYSDQGTKRATVEVTSDGQSITRDCSTYVSVDNNLSFSCYPDRNQVALGQQMNWISNVSGGNGDYSYYWSGADVLNTRNETASVVYNTPGTKYMSLRVSSNGRSTTRSCGSVFVSGVAGFSGGVTVTSNPVAAPLSSAVYLSQVPYTGLELSWKLVAFVGALILWSVWIAYFIIRKKVLRNMAKDTATVSSLEEEARKENVVISEDALQSVIKRAKAEKVIASEVLKRVIAKAKAVSGNDSWIALSKEKLNNL